MVTVIPKTQYRGRKMKPGRPVATPDMGVVYFVCYCESCDSKVVCTREYLQRLVKTSQKSSMGLRMRIIKLLMATMSDKNL